MFKIRNTRNKMLSISSSCAVGALPITPQVTLCNKGFELWLIGPPNFRTPHRQTSLNPFYLFSILNYLLLFISVWKWLAFICADFISSSILFVCFFFVIVFLSGYESDKMLCLIDQPWLILQSHKEETIYSCHFVDMMQNCSLFL